MKPQRAVASFDSASAMLRTLSHYLAGRDAPATGQAFRRLEPAVSALLWRINRLPASAAERLYALSGVAESVRPDSLGQVDAGQLASWVVEHYPKRRYPVVFIGSSNGAMIHLAAALGAPWLPQTLLIPVRRRGVDRDDPSTELTAGLEPARRLLGTDEEATNQDLVLHHMHDPNQDRLMIAGMSYFRVKYRRLPQAYRRFLRRCLAPGGVVVSVECGLRWPSTAVSDRHLFQFGAHGGATQREYQEGGPRVAEFLARYGSSWRRWTPPEPDLSAPEAEWGFDEALLDDLQTAGREHPYELRRLRFGKPETLSPVVADIYRDWYARLGIPTERLLVESFLLMEPWLALRTGSVPLWTGFNTRGSHHAVNAYLDGAASYDEIRMMLFSHGTDSIGLASAEQWQSTVDRARKVGTLVGADLDAYPRDFASLVRSHQGLTRVRQVYDMPEPLKLDHVEPALRHHPYVEWTE